MTRRAKVRWLAMVAIGVALTALLWPRDNRAAQEALDELRGMIEVETERTETDAQQPERSEQVVEVQLCIAKLCLADATAALFAGPAELGQETKVVQGRVRSLNNAQAIIERLAKMGVLEVVSMPLVQNQSGQASFMMTGCQLAVAPSNPAPAPGIIALQDVGCQTSVLPTVLKDRTLQVELEVELSWLADGPVTPATAANPTPPKISKASTGKITARLRSGETLVVAGLTMNGRGVKTLKAPLLSKLPGVGGWFSWTYDRDVEEELIVLATPRVLPKQP